jgi:hypothetical protein
MEPHQRLEAFLPRLHEELVRNGLSEEAATFICGAVRAGAQQPSRRSSSIRKPGPSVMQLKAS